VTPGRTDQPGREIRRRNHRFLSQLVAGANAPLVVAHRGDSARAPENTLAAGLRARNAGADAWEFDVQLTRDGMVVVIHDASLLRTTDVARRFPRDPRAASGYQVADFDYPEICCLDAGSWFLADEVGTRNARDFGTRGTLDPGDVAEFASGAVRIPSLREVLELTLRLDWLANVELKSFPDSRPALLEAVRDVARAVGAVDRLLISSFDHAEVARARDAEPHWATGVLAHTPLSAPDRYVAELVGADCFHPSSAALGAEGSAYRNRPGAARLGTDVLPGFLARGIPVLVYTVNDARPDGLADHLARAGVAALFTDDPGSLRRLFPRQPS
jgi:glycerophosphoryl diester phosphodiesterase